MFTGRLSIRGYWLSFVVMGIFVIPFNIEPFASLAQENIYIRYGLGLLLIAWLFSVFTRRFHDLNIPSSYVLLILVPILDIFVGFYLGFMSTQDSKNNYGKRLNLIKEVFPIFVEK